MKTNLILLSTLWNTLFVSSVQSFSNNDHVQRKQLLHPTNLDLRHGQIDLKSCCLFGSNSDTVTTTEADDKCDVAIFGGGFGGLYTALAIARENSSPKNKGKKKLDIALVDPSKNFVFLPLLYDLAIGTASEIEVCPTYKDILQGTGIRHIRASLDSCTTSDATIVKVPLNSNNKDSNVDDENSNNNDGTSSKLSFRSAVVAVGATPESILESVPGALDCVQPFYTKEDAYNTRRLLNKLEKDDNKQQKQKRKIAVIGGGYGGVELSACIQRKLPNSQVTLLTRGPPMKGTRAEPIVDQILNKLGVTIELCAVDAIEQKEFAQDGEGKRITPKSEPKYVIQRTSVVDDTSLEDEEADVEEEDIWDAVFWTAGSTPAYPLSSSSDKELIDGLQKTNSGRLAIDDTLRCIFEEKEPTMEDTTDSNDKRKRSVKTAQKQPPLWSIGDCAEVISDGAIVVNAIPKTAQAAMQQSDVVASNVLNYLNNDSKKAKVFKYQDLGSMLSLGGPNGAVLAPSADDGLSPLIGTALDTTRKVLEFADDVFIVNSPVAKQLGVTPITKNLGLSFGGYGLGYVDDDNTEKTAAGTLAGTVTGGLRRAVYAARMPTNKQRTFAAVSAVLSTTASLAKEISDEINNNQNKKDEK